MRKHFLVPILVGIFALGAAQAFAQSATVVMRNGDRVQAEVMDMGRNFSFRVNGQPRSVPIGDVVLLDFAGNVRDISTDDLTRANAVSGYVVMRNGETFNASLNDLTGKPLIAVFSNGRRSNLSDVARVYFGGVSNVAGFPNLTSTTPPAQQPVETSGAVPRNAPPRARSVVVPANVQWSNTGFNVRRGQVLRFEPSGEVRLSFNGDDVARPAGALNGRKNERALLGDIPVGALSGRVGNGRPFAIGNADNPIDMPDNGRLYLSINDDHHADNSGNYVVYVWE